MNEKITSDWMDEDLVKDAAATLFESLGLHEYPYLNIHFIPNVLSDMCSVEVKELLDGYEMFDNIALVIVTCNTDIEAETWKKENSIPDSWHVFLDHDRDVSKKFSNLNTEYDIPERLSCLINQHGDVLWLMKNGISDKRNMLLSNEFNKGFQTLKNIEE